MKKVFIKYNPYKVTTEIKIDDKELKKNSRLNFDDEKRLQEWVDELPQMLFEECSTKDFDITFHGTVLDYEDLVSVAEAAKKDGININLNFIPAKEYKDKEQAIDELFQEIQKGPFEELRSPDVIHAFEMAKSSDFEVNVVATMSAGKSTLINSLLGTKLMPAKQEACTATITEIKDNDIDHFEAQAFDSQGAMVKSFSNLTYENMDELNGNSQVSTICVEGDIPFVTADEVSLVLVDTPGPNNSRDQNHKKATLEMLSKSSKTLVLYIMNATQLAVDDDNNLLDTVSESMKVGGKQSRDRFIFVLNKLDDFKKGEDSVESAIKKVQDYLADKGIENPNIFPASALTALNIRTILAESDDDDDDDVYEAKGKVRKFNRNLEMHFEDYAPLPTSAKNKIQERLKNAIEVDDSNEQALIHSGIVPIEEAIRIYVQKYAQTAKIKNMVATFESRLAGEKTEQKLKIELGQKRSKAAEIKASLDKIKEKIDSGEEAKKFKEKIDNINYDDEIIKLTNNTINKAQEKITYYLTHHNDKMTVDEAKKLYNFFVKFAETIQAEVQVKLEHIIERNMMKNVEQLLDEYKSRLSDLATEVDTGDIVINPFEIMKGYVPSNKESIISDSIQYEYKKVKKGEKWVVDQEKKKFLFFTIRKEKGHFEDIIENVREQYVNERELAEKFFAPVQEQLYENCDSAQKYAKKQAKRIKEDFKKKFDELDLVLKDKLKEFEICTSDSDKAQRELEDAEKKDKWLKEIDGKMKAILEI